MKPSFKDESLFALAMTHRGVDGLANNQRLEFLGDRVLGLVVASMLYEAYPEAREGELAKRLAALVRGETVVRVAETIGLKAWVLLADSEEQSGGRDNASNLEDACEALIGALYLDGGLAQAEAFIRHYWQPLISEHATPPKDAKTALQEWAQGNGLGLPIYTEISREGPDHAPLFTILVKAGDYEATGAAYAKRAAEQAAAKTLLDKVEL